MSAPELSILLVDDHALIRDGVELILARLPGVVRVEQAGSAAQARELLAARSFTLVILDYYLPDAGNVSALASLQALAGETPVVVLSSECSGDLVRSTLAAGVRGFIPKTSTAEIMLAALGVVLSGGVYVPPDALDLPARDGAGLTMRQRDVLELLVNGHTNKEIAERLGTSESTVRVHLTGIFRALGVDNRTTACSVALQRHLVRKA